MVPLLPYSQKFSEKNLPKLKYFENMGLKSRSSINLKKIQLGDIKDLLGRISIFLKDK